MENKKHQLDDSGIQEKLNQLSESVLREHLQLWDEILKLQKSQGSNKFSQKHPFSFLETDSIDKFVFQDERVFRVGESGYAQILMDQLLEPETIFTFYCRIEQSKNNNIFVGVIDLESVIGLESTNVTDLNNSYVQSYGLNGVAFVTDSKGVSEYREVEKIMDAEEVILIEVDRKKNKIRWSLKNEHEAILELELWNRNNI